MKKILTKKDSYLGQTVRVGYMDGDRCVQCERLSWITSESELDAPIAGTKLRLENTLNGITNIPSPADCIALGEQAVANAGFSAARLVTLMDLLMTTKEANALASKPKLVALYAWLQTVKGLAVAGSTEFPASPHTFEEVVSE